MTLPVLKARTLVTDDGVPIDAAHLPGDRGLGIVLAHGFTLNWQRPSVWRIARRLSRYGGVVTFDFRGHGRSGGLSTLGDREIRDVDVAVAYARELGYQRIAVVGFSMGASIVLRYAGLIGGVGQRPGPVVLPGDEGDAAGALGGGAQAWPAVRQQGAEHQDQLGPVGSGAGAAG